MKEEPEITMHRRRILLSDERYLIFFTFADQAECLSRAEARAEPETKKEN